MNRLNEKIKSSFDSVQDRALVTGLYGYNETTKKWNSLSTDGNAALNVNVHGGSVGSGDLKARTTISDPATSTFLKCNTDGTLELTAELDTSSLAKEAVQTDGTQKSKCMGIKGDGNQQQLLVESNGSLIIGGGSVKVGNTVGDGSGDLKFIRTDANGELLVNFGSSTTQNVNCYGVTSGGVQTPVAVDGSGNLLVKEVGTVNISPANTNNSHITDDPANTVAVGLKGRTTIGTATTETFLLSDAQGHLQVDNLSTLKSLDDSSVEKELRADTHGRLYVGLNAYRNTSDPSSTGKLLCDADGHLQVDIVSGGGSPSNSYDSINMTSRTDSTDVVNSSYIDLTNANNIRVEVLFSGTGTERTNAVSDLQLSMEFTDDNANTVCYSGAASAAYFQNTLLFDSATTGFCVGSLIFGESTYASSPIRGKFGRIILYNSNNTGNSTAYAVTAKVILSAA